MLFRSIRHGEVEEKYHRIFGGRIDMNLSANGHEQAATLARYLQRKTVHAVYASPMKRVQQTLAPYASTSAPQAVVMADLREVDFGEWTGHYAGGAKLCTVLDIKAIYHRNDPILVGVPPMGAGPDEMARYRAVMRSATIKQNMQNAGVPDVQQVWCHEIGGARMFHGISIKQRYPGLPVVTMSGASRSTPEMKAFRKVISRDEDDGGSSDMAAIAVKKRLVP